MNQSLRRKAKTIGVLVDWTVDSYQQMILSGIMDFTREFGLGCICFEGGGLRSPFEHEAQRNVIFDLATKTVIDGLIILAPTIGHFIGKEEILSFCNRYRDFPIVNISMDLNNIPSVLIDNTIGMRELMLHLIEHHHYTRFAFLEGVKGDQDALAREKIFAETLQEHGVAVDPQLIYQGDYALPSGVQAVRHFLESGRRDIDVIVAANDGMALGALEELSRQGIRVPEEIAVTGFDDIDMSGYSSPALTTVRLPIYEMGWTAGKRLMDLLNGQDGSLSYWVATKLVVRESCRCMNVNALAPAKLVSAGVDASASIDIGSARSRKRDSSPTGKTKIGNQKKSSKNPSTSKPLRDLEQSDFWEAQRMLSNLWYHRTMSGTPDPHTMESEDRMFQSIVKISQEAIRSEWTRIQGFIHENVAYDLIRTLIAISNISDQVENIAVWMPKLGIASCYLSLYREETKGRDSVCLLGIRDNQRVDIGTEGIVFPTKDLVPDNFLSNGNRRMLIVESLNRIGFVVFEMQPGQGRIFNMISYLIGGALQSALLFQELQSQKNNLSLNLEHMRKVMAGFIQTMSSTVEAKDPYTSGHQNRVSDLARTIAQEMNLPPLQVEAVRMAGIIHDLGKIYVPAEILNRPSRLDEIEWNMIKKHPKVAYDILKNVDFPWPLAEIVYQHHERLDGSGYPCGLKANEISLEAKILAVADVVEAMSSHRPYREALGLENALGEITSKKGILFDPDAVDACVRLFRSKGYRLKLDSFSPFSK